MDTIKLPIEYESNGLKKLTDGSDDYYKQLLSIAARTEPGVHPIFPEFGVADPTFNIIDRGQFMVSAARYVPEVRILSIDTFQTDSEQAVTFTFTRRY